jgi:hypothetical protein
MEKQWTQEDVAKLVSFLNMVGTHARLDLNVSEIIKFYGLLNWCQTSLKKRIEDNIFEITNVTQPEKPYKPAKAKKVD